VSQDSTDHSANRDLVGVRGWLAFFLLTMMAFSPLMDIAYLTEHPDQIYSPLVWLLVLVLHGLGFYAGILMLRGKAKGVKWAKIRLIVGLGIAALGLVGTVVSGFADPKTVTSSDITSSLRPIVYSNLVSVLGTIKTSEGNILSFFRFA
jgi:hypothetical protein